ncbi:DUF3482 domain-containing protein [Zoogloea sp.]|uniref:DUF3482 domain-containing protein n=1 Tax=Zoogloea sp. TaxID=49181 RepID=UPI0026103847|nr:DUF3482 domain-containing protein [Zoogloea sp.]MDD3352607.1 DUF3482 domain-containing protein [Zoogloea sp.]
MNTINLSLVSHTNTGKTTLARSLLGRDVGEIRDEAHVTAVAERYRMVDTGNEALDLWDTPGFGDSTRLARRLALQGNPVGWFLSEVWDRWRDRPLWSSQQALRNVRDVADVVLYLVNATEKPGDAGYVKPEMEILAWIGKPVLVLLNQLGEPHPDAQDKADEEAWRAHLAAYPFVRHVMPLDAFARCWIQELALLDAIARILPTTQQDTMKPLRAAWQQRRMDEFGIAMKILTRFLAEAAQDTETLPDEGLGGTLRTLGHAMGIGRRDAPSPREEAMTRLAERLETAIRRSTDQLIETHGLGGRAASEVLARLGEDFTARERLHAGKAALLGGAVSGALSGLATDLATGGLSLGAGLVGGTVLGALGSAGLATGVNLIRRSDHSRLEWSPESLERLMASTLLRYLSVAHYGRGRGEWRQSGTPGHWQEALEGVLEPINPRLPGLWKALRNSSLQEQASSDLETLLHDTTLRLLNILYPVKLILD